MTYSDVAMGRSGPIDPTDPRFHPLEVHVRRWAPEVRGFLDWLRDEAKDSWETKRAREWLVDRVPSAVFEKRVLEVCRRPVDWGKRQRSPEILVRTAGQYLTTFGEPLKNSEGETATGIVEIIEAVEANRIEEKPLPIGWGNIIFEEQEAAARYLVIATIRRRRRAIPRHRRKFG